MNALNTTISAMKLNWPGIRGWLVFIKNNPKTKCALNGLSEAGTLGHHRGLPNVPSCIKVWVCLRWLGPLWRRPLRGTTKRWWTGTS